MQEPLSMDTVAAGLVTLVVEVAGHYGIGANKLWAAAGSDPLHAEPDALVPRELLFRVVRVLHVQSGDPRLGLRMAEQWDLRRQGMWGYAVLASMSMRERIDCYHRYQAARMPAETQLHIDGDRANFDIHSPGIPPDLRPVLLDFAFVATCTNHRKRIQRSDPDMQAWLSYPERPHHHELRRAVGGPVVFEAPLDRLQLRAADLDLPLQGDPHLGELAHAQLARGQSSPQNRPGRDFLQQLRELLESDLSSGGSHEQVARRMGLSARTLRRRVTEQGTSFQALLEEVRHARALALLAERSAKVEHVARALGYADSSNFRRAFRRWTGQSPRAYQSAGELGRK